MIPPNLEAVRTSQQRPQPVPWVPDPNPPSSLKTLALEKKWTEAYVRDYRHDFGILIEDHFATVTLPLSKRYALGQTTRVVRLMSCEFGWLTESRTDVEEGGTREEKVEEAATREGESETPEDDDHDLFELVVRQDSLLGFREDGSKLLSLSPWLAAPLFERVGQVYCQERSFISEPWYMSTLYHTFKAMLKNGECSVSRAAVSDRVRLPRGSNPPGWSTLPDGASERIFVHPSLPGDYAFRQLRIQLMPGFEWTPTSCTLYKPTGWREEEAESGMAIRTAIEAGKLGRGNGWLLDRSYLSEEQYSEVQKLAGTRPTY